MDLVLLFDLDGTLTDSREGIVKSVRYALERLSLPSLPEETLLRFIGPPLEDSFQRYCGLTEAGAGKRGKNEKQRWGRPIAVFRKRDEKEKRKRWERGGDSPCCRPGREGWVRSRRRHFRPEPLSL